MYKYQRIFYIIFMKTIRFAVPENKDEIVEIINSRENISAPVVHVPSVRFIDNHQVAQEALSTIPKDVLYQIRAYVAYILSGLADRVVSTKECIFDPVIEAPTALGRFTNLENYKQSIDAAIALKESESAQERISFDAFALVQKEEVKNAFEKVLESALCKEREYKKDLYRLKKMGEKYKENTPNNYSLALQIEEAISMSAYIKSLVVRGEVHFKKQEVELYDAAIKALTYRFSYKFTEYLYQYTIDPKKAVQKDERNVFEAMELTDTSYRIFRELFYELHRHVQGFPSLHGRERIVYDMMWHKIFAEIRFILETQGRIPFIESFFPENFS